MAVVNTAWAPALSVQLTYRSDDGAIVPRAALHAACKLAALNAPNCCREIQPQRVFKERER